MCGVGTDASTLITSQRANFPVMEGTTTQLGPDGCQGTGKKNTHTQGHKHTDTRNHMFHVCGPVLRYIQIYSDPVKRQVS